VTEADVFSKGARLWKTFPLVPNSSGSLLILTGNSEWTLRLALRSFLTNIAGGSKPHPITIMIGLLSPILSLVALGLSLQGLKVSQRAAINNEAATRLSQRAYLSIEHGTIELKIMPRAGKVFWDKSLILVTVTLRVSNTGNTPGQVKNIKLNYVYPHGWNPYARGVQATFKEIPPKQSLGWTEAWLITLSQEQQSAFEKQEQFLRKNPQLTAAHIHDLTSFHPRSFLKILGDLVYEDTFGNEHHQKWCWNEPPLGQEPYAWNCPNFQADMIIPFAP